MCKGSIRGGGGGGGGGGYAPWQSFIYFFSMYRTLQRWHIDIFIPIYTHAHPFSLYHHQVNIPSSLTLCINLNWSPVHLSLFLCKAVICLPADLGPSPLPVLVPIATLCMSEGQDNQVVHTPYTSCMDHHH